MPPPMMSRMRLPERIMSAKYPILVRLQRRLDVGMDEIFALEKQRQIPCFCQSIGKAVAEIQFGGMARTSAKFQTRRYCGVQLLLSKRNQCDERVGNQPLQKGHSFRRRDARENESAFKIG